MWGQRKYNRKNRVSLLYSKNLVLRKFPRIRYYKTTNSGAIQKHKELTMAIICNEITSKLCNHSTYKNVGRLAVLYDT